MSQSTTDLAAYLLTRLERIQANLGFSSRAEGPQTRFADVLDSMGMVEFLGVVAEDCGITPVAIEQCVDRRFGTVAELAQALHTAGFCPRNGLRAKPRLADEQAPTHDSARSEMVRAISWLAATGVRLPDTVQSAAVINEVLQRPKGWLERHAGIQQRRMWGNQDPLAAAAEAGRECLERAGVAVKDVGALLVTSEAPPLLIGLAAALHDQLHLDPSTVALEIGGACTAFLSAVWTAQFLLPSRGVVLIVAVESPTNHLQLKPGRAGEAAALFGDGAAAAVLSERPFHEKAVPLGKVALHADGKARRVLRLESTASSGIELHMRGIELADRAVHVMAQSVQDQLQSHGLALADLEAVIAHGGNGRLPALLARLLGLETERVRSETPRTGNLGSASLPVAWTAHQPGARGTAIWTAVGAGLTWGAVLVGEHLRKTAEKRQAWQNP